MQHSDGDPVIEAGLPARVLGALLPLAGVVVVLVGAARGGLVASAEDPVPPAAVAALSVLGCIVLGYRALSQRVVLGEHSLRSRNVLVSYGVEWQRVEALVVVHRPGLWTVELDVADLRRRQRLGAASRFDEQSFAEVLEALRSHPSAAGVLVETQP